MTWRPHQNAARERYCAAFSDAVAARWVQTPSEALVAAYRCDITDVFPLESGLRVLEVGAGTGTFTRILQQVAGLAITAMEPTPAMFSQLSKQMAGSDVCVVNSYCDSEGDRDHFPPAQFDLIISRQVANELYDPLTAFRNWHHWLNEGGSVVLIDGLFTREAWNGPLEGEVDALPLAANQSLALVPYLLEACGFGISAVKAMAAVNAMTDPSFKRYIIAARKPCS